MLRIAHVHETTPAQVALGWGIQRGTVVIPKSENPERMRQNITVRCMTQRNYSSRASVLTAETPQLIKLTSEDMTAIDGIHQKPGMHRSLLKFHLVSIDAKIHGWTYEQLGWNMKQGGIIVE